MIILKTNRTYYGAEEAERETMTVGELIDILRMYDEDDKVAFSNDNGYTYGYIGSDTVEEMYVPHLHKYLAEGIEYELDEDDDPDDVKDLPTTMTVECYEQYEVEDAVSDETGWLVKSIESIKRVD